MLGFSLDLGLIGFGTWRMDLGFCLFVSLALFHFVWKALGQRGSVD
jgi:hypothetical protein